VQVLASFITGLSRLPGDAGIDLGRSAGTTFGLNTTCATCESWHHAGRRPMGQRNAIDGALPNGPG